MKLTNILKEIVVRGNNILSSKDLNLINEAFPNFGEGDSGFDLYNPISEYASKYTYGEDSGPNGEYEPYEDEDNYPEYRAFNTLIKTKREGINYVGNDIYGIGKCPGAPSNAFYIRLKIESVNYLGQPDPNLTVEIPYLSEDGSYYVVWFDASGKYYADTTHFDKDGNYLG